MTAAREAAAEVRGRAFRDRDPTPHELERLRLVLSTFQDGSGNVRMADGTKRADWRQVERAIAEVFDGETAENKGVFDALFAVDGSLPFGLSIKTSRRRGDDRVLMELANSPRKFMLAAEREGVDWNEGVEKTGAVAVREISSWHHQLDREVDVARSRYAVLTHDTKKVEFELFSFELALPDPKTLRWEIRGEAVVGRPAEGRPPLFEFYPRAGGQVKYYPAGDAALYRSGVFRLETPPAMTLLERAAEYWPDAWEAANSP